jgi:hypothetical protein
MIKARLCFVANLHSVVYIISLGHEDYLPRRLYNGRKWAGDVTVLASKRIPFRIEKHAVKVEAIEVGTLAAHQEII